MNPHRNFYLVKYNFLNRLKIIYFTGNQISLVLKIYNF